PRRIRVENSSPSRTTHSAAVAPPAMARRTMSWATSLRSVSSFWFLVSRVSGIENSSTAGSWEKLNASLRRSVLSSWFLVLRSLHEAAGVFSCGSTDCEAVYFQRGNADAYRDGLTVFAAGADAFVEFQIVAYHG